MSRYRELNEIDKQRFQKNFLKGFFASFARTLLYMLAIAAIGFVAWYVLTSKFGFVIPIVAAAFGFWSYSAYKNAKDIQHYLETWRKAYEDDLCSLEHFNNLHRLLVNCNPEECQRNNVKHYITLDEEEREAELFRLCSRINYYKDRVATAKKALEKYE